MIDHYADEIRGRPYCPGCRWILAGATALGIVGLAGMAWGQEEPLDVPIEMQQPTATVYVHVCDADRNCKTVNFPVTVCLPNAQAIFGPMLAESGWTIRAWKCLPGDPA